MQYFNYKIFNVIYSKLTGEIDITDLDDEELDGYIMSEKEAAFKSTLWNKVNEKYLQEQKGMDF